MRVSLPEGHVTFAFTDVEGSTRLVTRDPVAGRRALARHHELLARAVGDHDGVVFETVGDAVYAAFPGTRGALLAAVAMQRAMRAEDWGTADGLRVRTAVHGGEVERQGDHYFGVPLFVCARLQALAHAGQTLASTVAVEAVFGEPLEDVRILALGRHRLKDFGEPIGVVQVSAAGLPDRFPPLRTSVDVPTNLPARVTSFLDREAEIGAIGELLTNHRLVTILGAGGTGKTSLAVESASVLKGRFPDGVFLVDLTPLTEPTAVAESVAVALGLPPPGTEGPETALLRHLGRLEQLLVLDNWEHLLAGVAFVGRVLAAAPGVRILATSRVPLRLPGEQRFRLEPLSLPLPGARAAEAAGSGAVRLFLERARDVDPSLASDPATMASIATLCQRLDGLPLGIELAASRVDVLSPDAILRGLDARAEVLLGSPSSPDRHQSLGAVVGWSVRLLAPGLQQGFARLGAFAGTFDLAAASALIAPGAGASLADLSLDPATAMAALADASLVVRRGPSGGETRFALLQTMRTHALDMLEASEEMDAVRRAHAALMADLAEAGEHGLNGPDAVAWSRRLGLWQDDIKAAVAWDLEVGEGSLAGRTIGAMWRFWVMRFDYRDGISAAERALQLPMDGRWRARVANTVLTLALPTGGWPSPEVIEAMNPDPAVSPAAEVADHTNNLAVLEWYRGHPDVAMEQLRRSAALWRDVGNPRGEAVAISNQAAILVPSGVSAADALLLSHEALRLARLSGSVRGIAEMVISLVVNARGMVQRSALGVSAEDLRSALRLMHEIGDQIWTATAILCLAWDGSVEAAADLRRVTRLLGAAELAHRRPDADGERDVFETVAGLARPGMGDRAFALAIEEGRALDRDAAVSYALEESDPFVLWADGPAARRPTME